MPDWTQANRISDRIVDLVREELKQPDADPVQIWAGLLLGFLAFSFTAPAGNHPPAFDLLVTLAEATLVALRDGEKPNV